MCDRLAEANARVTAETTARIKTIEQLRHSDRLATVGKLASGITHELGTPLNVVLARAKMIGSGQPPQSEVAVSARIISEQTIQMTKIIRQLLDFVRPRSPRKLCIDVRQVVQQILGLLRSMAEKSRVSFQFDGEEKTVHAELDPNQIQQVLSNLIVNGIQAMPNGGVLTVGLEKLRTLPPADHGGPEGDYIRLQVKDSGVGVSEENKVRLFEPFFTTKGVGEGTGLGLSVSLGIVREHGGRSGWKAKWARGVVFPFTSRRDLSMRGRVLIIEDDRSMCELLEVGLRQHGFEVIAMISAVEIARVLGATD